MNVPLDVSIHRSRRLALIQSLNNHQAWSKNHGTTRAISCESHVEADTTIERRISAAWRKNAHACMRALRRVGSARSPVYTAAPR